MNLRSMINAIKPVGALSVMAFGLVACAGIGEPEVTHDGLVEQQGAKVGTVYAKPGASVLPYTQFAIDECTVSFRKNWLRDQNSARRSIGNKVTETDMDRIRSTLSGLCSAEFTSALEREPGYKIVALDEANAETLVLVPNIIDLDVSAPDVQSPSRTRTFTAQSGEMTLFLEVVDASTGEILYRVVDRRRDNRTMQLEWSNTVTNTADAKRILRSWGNQLREGLDHVVAREKGGA